MTPENFPDSKIFKPGDAFVMHTRTSTLSWLIMYLTSSIWSHSGLFLRDGYIADATTAGVVKHPFLDYLDDQSYIAVLDVPYQNDTARDEVEAYAESKLGTPYGWATAFNIGLSILLGQHHSYHPKFSADVLLVLAVLSLPALLWKRWLYCTSIMAFCYLVAVIYNLAGSQESKKRVQRMAAIPTPVWRRFCGRLSLNVRPYQ